MIHARKDYNRIQDPDTVTGIGYDEPVFLLRAQDVLMVPMLRHYVELTRLLDDHDPKIVRLLEQHMNQVAEWQATHPHRVADA